MYLMKNSACWIHIRHSKLPDGDVRVLTVLLQFLVLDTGLEGQGPVSLTNGLNRLILSRASLNRLRFLHPFPSARRDFKTCIRWVPRRALFRFICDVSIPDLSVEKAIRYTARILAAHRSQPNSVCISTCALFFFFKVVSLLKQNGSRINYLQF